MRPRNGVLDSLEQWSPSLFFLGTIMFVISAFLSAGQIVAGTERLSLLVGEAFIAAGWMAGLVGLLGLYPGLADRSRWLSRAGVVFAVLGVLVFATLAVVSLYAFVAGYGPGDFPLPVVYLIPGVFVGSLLAFVSFSGATLRSDEHRRTLSVFLLVPSAIFVTNLFILPAILGPGPSPPEVGIVVVMSLALSMLALGYLLWTGPDPTDRPDPVRAEVRYD